LLLAQAGFANELVTLKNKHRACQCTIVHVVMKTRIEELQQLRDGPRDYILVTIRTDVSSMH
jgi:late competence protein required for DNA uptake (superfamily II DNA/RNA helicase)